ncbi:MAG TPA: NAD(P)H-dependent oxidoreductase [Polyangiaceae bacterium]|nr:NAD(P)H-dependent oxidoreductase [Polyangiaceae bacterium]
MAKILLQFAHPILERSRVNAPLLAAARSVEGVLVNDLYERYPKLDIDVAREQELLLKHDVIVFQHPFYWYSAPAIVKEWQDLVLEHGFAYGHTGHALSGKATFNAITTGGPESAYQRGGYNRFTVRELLAPFDQTAQLCGMRFLAPFVVYGSLRLPTTSSLEPYAERYRRLLQALAHDELDWDRASSIQNLATLFEPLPGTLELQP